MKLTDNQIAAIIIVAVILLMLWQPWKRRSKYKNCMGENWIKDEGEECTNCIPDGSKQANWRGVIKDRVCVRADNTDTGTGKDTSTGTGSRSMEMGGPVTPIRRAFIYPYMVQAPLIGMDCSMENITNWRERKVELIRERTLELNSVKRSEMQAEIDYMNMKLKACGIDTRRVYRW